MSNSFSPFEPASLAGKVALITGAGGGIGGATARRLAGCGVRLVLTDLNRENLERVAQSLPEAEVLTWSGDLTSEAAVQELFRTMLERYGRVDIAVNAAGLLRTTPFEQISKREWDQVVDVNAGSTFLVCQACCAPMREQGWGRIINFASVAAHVGGILAGAHYAAGKAAVVALTKSVAKILAPHGVRCNAIAPSGVQTEMLHEFTEAQRADLVRGIPVGRFGTAEEMAELVLWLASPASDFITGQTININGGVYLG